MIGPFGMEPKGTMSARAVPLARALVARGHQVQILMPPWHTPEQAGRSWEQDGIDLTYVQLGSRWSPLSPLMTTIRLVRRALANQPDVIHCFKPKAYAGLAAWLVWHMQRVGLTQARLVVDEDDWEGAGGWNDLEPYPRLLKAFFSWQESWGLGHNQGLVVASRALETCVWSRGVPPERMLYLPNGGQSRPLGNGQSIRDELGLGDEPVMLLYTRFFEFEPARLVRVFRRVVDAIPGTWLLIVGEALFAEHDLEFKAAVTDLALREHVINLGWDSRWVESGYLQDLFAVADCALYPMNDTLTNRCKCPAKLVSLLFAGVPIVADAVGQIKEYVQPPLLGDLVTSGDEDAMAEYAIKRLRDRERKRGDRIIAQRIAWMASRYGWDQLANQLERLYLYVSARHL